MASDSCMMPYLLPVGWLTGALLLAGVSGWCFASDLPWWGGMAVVAAIVCGYIASNGIRRLYRRVRYLIDATLNGDFSYKFPTEDVSRDERYVNRMLNRIVKHLEHLTTETSQNEAFLAWAINLMDIGIAVADACGDIRHHNDAALRLLERPALTNVCQIDRRAFSDLSITETAMNLNGSKFTVLTISDIRRPVQAVEVESWEKLTRVLTHEIMNSLTPIQSIAENMSGKAIDGEEAEAFATISSSSRSLMTFVKNFRKFSVLPEPKPGVMYVKPFLEKCVRMAESYAHDDNISISISCFPPDMMVYTDEDLLSQVILNIVKNAIEAHPKAITVEARVKADESVEIRIANDGEPIPDDIAGQIFTPFFTTRPSGNGIGLSLSRRIISHLGGTLTLATRPLTCFAVRL